MPESGAYTHFHVKHLHILDKKYRINRLPLPCPARSPSIWPPKLEFVVIKPPRPPLSVPIALELCEGLYV